MTRDKAATLAAILPLAESGQSACAIIKATGLSKSHVYRVLSDFGFNQVDCPNCGVAIKRNLLLNKRGKVPPQET